MNKSLRPKTDKDFGAPPAGYVAGRGRGAIGFASGVSRDAVFKAHEEKDGDLGDANYDEFSGYTGSLFNGGSFDNEDNEADEIYDMVESRMNGRRKKAREIRETEDIEEAKSALSFQKQFVGYKNALSKVSEEEWMSLPDAQERLKSKKTKREFLQALPDSLILSGDGMQSSSLNELGVAKQAVLAVSLDREEDLSVSSTIEPGGYLSELDSNLSKMSALSEIGEVKKARLLFRSITRSDPTNSTAWLASARLEEASNNVPEAKVILATGISHCPHSEELWLNAVRLEKDLDKCKSLIANGIRQNPKNANLWLQAVELEEKNENKYKVFQKAIETVATSVELWKGLVNLVWSMSDTKDALLLLERSVVCCPHSEDLWLMYAKLSNSQKVLNEARRAIPTSIKVWISAAELAERTNPQSVFLILAKGIESLGKNGVVEDRRKWYEFASKCEFDGYMIVAKSIIKLVLVPDINSMFQRDTPKAMKHRIVYSDFDFLQEKRNFKCAFAVLETAVLETDLRQRKGIWIKLLQSMDRDYPVDEMFEKAVLGCPYSHVLWLMYAKHLWTVAADLDSAISVLNRALQYVSDCEDVYLAMLKLVDCTKFEEIIQQGINACKPNCVRIYIKSVQFLRKSGKVAAVCSQVNEAVTTVGSSRADEGVYKLYLIACHSNLETGNLVDARTWVSRACEACPNISAVWLIAANVAMIEKDFSRARSILERGRLRLPNDENLWWKGLMVECESHTDSMVSVGTAPSVKSFISRALQACPNSGLLWSWAITLEPAATRHPKCLDALKRCETDPLVVCAIGSFFWIEKLQYEKARKWFQNALKLSMNFGQVWADFLAFEVSQGDDNYFNVEAILREAQGLDMDTVNKGIEWNEIVKRVENWDKNLIENILVFMNEKHSKIDLAKFSRISQLINEVLAGGHVVKTLPKMED